MKKKLLRWRKSIQNGKTEDRNSNFIFDLELNIKFPENQNNSYAIFITSTLCPIGQQFRTLQGFFQELGFTISWDAGDYIGFEKDGCKFILQKFDNREFAENFMISVVVSNVDEFRKEVINKQLPEKFGIRIGDVSDQPYGREINIIDMAGVCWHFVQ